MLSSGNQARAALQKHFAKPITDSQWEMLAAQGYEQAIVSGQRTAEAVAEELHALMEFVRVETDSAQPSGPGPRHAEPLTWEGMEKWVLGRALIAGGFGGGRPAPGEPVTGMGTYMGIPEPRRRWWVWGAFAALVLAAILAFVFLYLLDRGPASTATSSSTSSVSALTGTDPTSQAVTTTTASPVTTTSPSTSTTILTTTTVDLTPTYVAHLTGDEAVPAVTTDATGTLTLTVAEGGESVDYVLEVTGLSDLTVARLRVGEPGANGDEIFTVYPGPTVPGVSDGVVVQGSFTAAQLLGPLAGKTIADLVALVEDGSVYLNVGTVTNRGGEIRGQMK